MKSRILAATCLGLAAGCSTQTDYRGDNIPRFAPPALNASAQPRVALILGGGGPRGLAHIGVLKALEANGIAPDLIVGASSGALVGAAYASGLDAAAIERMAFELGPRDVFDFSYTRRGYILGEKLAAYVNRMVQGRTIERLPRAFAAVATEIKTGRSVIFNRGDTGLAVRASSAIPGQFHPVKIDGKEYLDGDLASPVPIKSARTLGAQVVIAIDVSAYLEDLPEKERHRIDWITTGVMRKAIVELERPFADIVIHPNLDYYAGWSDAYKRKCIDRAEAATLQAIPRIKALLAEQRTQR